MSIAFLRAKKENKSSLGLRACSETEGCMINCNDTNHENNKLN